MSWMAYYVEVSTRQRQDESVRRAAHTRSTAAHARTLRRQRRRSRPGRRPLAARRAHWWDVLAQLAGRSPRSRDGVQAPGAAPQRTPTSASPSSTA